uniref:Uncharacterized protein n=1 Tax=Romanomermis culicivorax TaxID=13658 RepID=A0A915ISV9_ROMCU
MILRLYILLAVWTRILAAPQDTDDIAKAILKDMSQRKNGLQKKERTVIAKDVVSTVNELNFRIKSIYLEIQHIQKSTESEKNGPKSEILKTMYDDHVRMYQESAQTMNQLVDAYAENRPQVANDNMAAFDETAWKNLLTKLQAAKVINQAFKYNHKLMHDSYLTIENVDLSQETRNFYQFLYITGDKCDKTGPKLIDPVSLQINDNARPEILHVEV